MNRCNFAFVLLMMLLLVALPLFCACGGKEEETPSQEQVILEPGLSAAEPESPALPDEPDPDPEPKTPDAVEEEFIDMGRASTIDDLMANKEKIYSYYFEQTIDSVFGEMFVKTWYTYGLMKIIRSFPDEDEAIEYFDFPNRTLVSYTPATDDYGIMMTFEDNDPEIPKEHLSNDYHQYRLVDTDTINGQICRVLQSRQGDKLWVSTKHGFPLQMEYLDPESNERLTVVFENLSFNQVRYEDVATPDDLEIIINE